MNPSESGRTYSLGIAVLTLNEAKRIRACLHSASFADQLVVIDSGSTDQTLEIARACGAETYTYSQWDGFAEQRNRALRHVRTDYVFFLDADEVLPPEAREEILELISNGKAIRGEIFWNQVAFGRPLTAMASNTGIERLFRRDTLVRFEGVVHEGAVLTSGDIPVAKLRNRVLHYSRETVYESIQKLAQYVQLGAAKRAALGKTGGIMRGVGSGLAIFLRLYFLRRGFLCGPEGFLFCFFVALECFFRYAALRYDGEILKTSAKR